MLFFTVSAEVPLSVGAAAAAVGRAADGSPKYLDLAVVSAVSAPPTIVGTFRKLLTLLFCLVSA